MHRTRVNLDKITFFDRSPTDQRIPLIPEFSQLQRDIGSLLGIITGVTVPAFLQMQQLLNDILTTLCLSVQADTPESLGDIPAYLIEMKDTFDHHYADPFSLDIYQDRYSISKYRLCREFSIRFGEPPPTLSEWKTLRNGKRNAADLEPECPYGQQPCRF